MQNCEVVVTEVVVVACEGQTDRCVYSHALYENNGLIYSAVHNKAQYAAYFTKGIMP